MDSSPKTYCCESENRISEVTRQEIIDLLVNGFLDPATSKPVMVPWSGRHSEPDFLGRLYNLKEMQSTDSRFTNAYDDIEKHMVYNDDWGIGWVFYDSRFNIKTGSDANFLNFLCQMFHPAVRKEDTKWQLLLELINEFLRIDGYELYEISHISGRPVYGWHDRDNPNLIIRNQTENLKQAFNSAFICKQIEAMHTAIENNPYDAIGKAKELLETCCKTILNQKSIPVQANWSLENLTKETCKLLKLTPDDIDQSVKASNIIKKLLGNLSAISSSMAELRNSYGSGHGKDAKFKGLTSRHARLAVGASSTAVQFIWETFEKKRNEELTSSTWQK